MLGSGVCATCDSQQSSAYQREIERILTRFFSSHHCEDCGEDEDILLDFWGGDHIWEMISNSDRPIDIRRQMNQSTVVCVSCKRRRIANTVGPWGIPVKP